MEIRGVDHFAKEAQFHGCCQKQYLVKRVSVNNAASCTSESSRDWKMNEKALACVYDHIRCAVIQKGNVIKHRILQISLIRTHHLLMR